jgi:hypothetical protein
MNTNDPTDKKPTTKKTKGAKVLASLVPEPVKIVRPSNIILHLKCSLRQIDEFIQENSWKTDSLTYNPSIPLEINTYNQHETENYSAFYNSEEDSNNNNNNTNTKSNKTAPPLVNESIPITTSSSLSQQKKEEEQNDSEHLKQKLKQLKVHIYKNEIDRKSDCFWCTYPFDNATCYILQYNSRGDICGHGSFCSPECALAHLYQNSTWDDSAKVESVQLINHYYGKTNNFQQSIKPAPSPYYFLDKFYGNMTIQEYRRLAKSNHMLLVVDKPVTRILSEIHEDNDSNTLTFGSGQYGNYKVKRQSEKTNVPNRNKILKEQFNIGGE